jgi:hypothetical protein
MPQNSFPTVAIVNDPTSGEKDADVKRIVAALGKQLLNDFGPAWHTGAHLKFVDSKSKPPAGAWVIALLDSSDVAGALGYHDLTPAGLPLGKVFAGTDRQYGQKVSVTLSHELLEMLSDPWISLTAQADDGRFFAWENCDAVEADGLGYTIDGVTVSDFVLPAWFGHGSGPVDHQGHLSHPLELAPGGYISVFDPQSGQGWQQVTARAAGSLSAANRFAARPKVGSRRERRFAGRSQWVLSTFETV